MTVLHVGENGRTYERRFNHEEAARLYASGEATQTELAARYGVTVTAISAAIKSLDPEWRKRENARRLVYMREKYRAPCVGGCGRLVWTHARGGGSGLCPDCSGKARATTVRDDTLLCTRCQEWKPDAAFQRGRNRKGRRGRAYHCRPCATLDRQEYRERHKVPCAQCGKPRLPENETGARQRGQTPTGLCLSCYRRSLRTEAA